MKKLILIIAITILATLGAQTQMTLKADLNNLVVGKVYSKTEFLDALKIKPTKTELDQWGDETEGNTTYYYFTQDGLQDEIEYNTEYGFRGFRIVTNRFTLFDGKFVIGDSLDKLKLIFKDSVFKKEETKENDDDWYTFMNYENLFYVRVDKNKIVREISHSLPM